MDVDEIRTALAKLSETEKEKLLRNLNRVTFSFKINKSFLKYSSHPITVPREFYPFLAIHGIVLEAEVHWYEGHGIGKKEIKIKRYL